MESAKRRTIERIVLCVLLAASLAGNIILYPLATRALPREEDAHVIERTIALHARGSQTRAAELRSTTFPIVFDGTGMNCVELRRRDGLGNLAACYRSDGRLVGESESVVN